MPSLCSSLQVPYSHPKGTKACQKKRTGRATAPTSKECLDILEEKRRKQKRKKGKKVHEKRKVEKEELKKKKEERLRKKQDEAKKKKPGK